MGIRLHRQSKELENWNLFGMGSGCTIIIRRFGMVMVNHQNGFVPNVKNALIIHMITAPTAARRWTGAKTMKTPDEIKKGLEVW